MVAVIFALGEQLRTAFEDVKPFVKMIKMHSVKYCNLYRIMFKRHSGGFFK